MTLVHEPKWTRFPVAETRSLSAVHTISDFFYIKRGVATGDNSYFILAEEDIKARGFPIEAFTPILPSPRYLADDEIGADSDGLPKIERRLFLLDTRLPEKEVKERFPSLWRYLEEGKARGLHERYLCSHRSPWYAPCTDHLYLSWTS
jgi:hypothetical protein